MPNTLDLRGLERMAEPAHRVLAKFIHGSSPDPATRTVATTALILSLWQLAGRGMSRQLPSVILLNAGEAERDPVDAFAASLVAEQTDTEPRMHKDGPFAFAEPELAPKAMANALRRMKQLGKSTPCDLELRRKNEERFFAAQRTGFGRGRCRPFAAAWHDEFGLLTDPGDQLILRLEGPADRVAFRTHVLGEPGKLREPSGHGAGLARVRKHIAVSGSLTQDLWDEKLAAGTVGLGLPFVLLPHLAQEPLAVPNQAVFDYLSMVLPNQFDSPVEEPSGLPPVDWFEACGACLRQRLHHLPPAYEYAMQRAVRELAVVCHRVADWTGRQSGGKPDEVAALFWDLHAHALRGIVIGIAGLAWHGLGFDPGCPRTKMVKVLGDLRKNGSMEKSDLQRCAHLTKAERDVLLGRLAAEDLVRVDGKTVAATGCAEFVAALYARKEFPEARNHWAAVTGKNKTSA